MGLQGLECCRTQFRVLGLISVAGRIPGSGKKGQGSNFRACGSELRF